MLCIPFFVCDFCFILVLVNNTIRGQEIISTATTQGSITWYMLLQKKYFLIIIFVWAMWTMMQNVKKKKKKVAKWNSFS